MPDHARERLREARNFAVIARNEAETRAWSTGTGARVAAEVKYDLRDGVAVILMDRPVANALAPGLRAELLEALSRVEGEFV